MPFARGLACSHPFSLSKGKAQGDLMAQKQGCLPAAGQPQSRLKKATSPKDDLCDCPVAGRVCKDLSVSLSVPVSLSVIQFLAVASL